MSNLVEEADEDDYQSTACLNGDCDECGDPDCECICHIAEDEDGGDDGVL